jgi:hypothetical protein
VRIIGFVIAKHDDMALLTNMHRFQMLENIKKRKMMRAHQWFFFSIFIRIRSRQQESKVDLGFIDNNFLKFPKSIKEVPTNFEGQ